MENFDPFDFKAAKAKRLASKLTISIDPGSTEYLFDASFESISRKLKVRFPEANFERQYNLHSIEAGTTIEIVLMGLSAGAGLIAAEVVKGMGKDLWDAIKTCIKKRGWFTNLLRPKGKDRLTLTLMHGETESVSYTHLTLPTKRIV